MLEKIPQRAVEAAALIERTGREALAEIRHLFGPVRRGEGEPLSGAQSIARVERAGASARATPGCRVELRVTGDAVELPAGIDLAAYRIVQEALTNALKHAGRARPRHGRATSRTRCVLSVEDDGEGPRDGYELGDAGGGHGLVGHARARWRCTAAIVQAGRAARRRLRGDARLPAPARRRARQTRRGAGMSIRVLLVDDQALIRAGFRMILDAEEDMEVVGECADGTQAVDSARRLKPDVVLMDIRMPEMDGIEATRLIAGARRARRGPRVLMLTTFDLDEYVYDALRAGASGFLLKDVPAEQLVDGIRVVAQGDALLAPSVTKRLIHEFSRGARSRSSAPPASSRS